jgi:uncharacterized membrane protein
MLGVDNTSEVLYHYLRALHVKVSTMTVHRLLDTPLGNSMRDISDALDSLHVSNAAYQLPKEYLDELEAPCIVIMNDNDSPFCLIEKIEETHITLSHSQRLRVSKQQFLQKWTGTVLVGEVTESTIQEKNCKLKDIAMWIQRHQLLLAGIIAILLILYSTKRNYSTGITLYLVTLCTGLLISSAILYKETANSRFLHRFCHIGKTIDCNEVLHSKGSHIIGMGLGELSLLYFSALLLFTLICPHEFYCISIICSIIAIGFTLYSVIYQLFIIRKGCMLCMLINLIVWSSCVILYIQKGQFNKEFSLSAMLSFTAIACICLTGWLQIKALLKIKEEGKQFKVQFSNLLNPDNFQKLLFAETQIGAMVNKEIALHNQISSTTQLMIVTNPNCKNCARIHSHIKEIASNVSISLVLLTFPKDGIGEKVAKTIIAAYRTDGWEKAITALEEWYKNHKIKGIDKYAITAEEQRIWKQQQIYCSQQHISQTPSMIIDGYYVPEFYQLKELKYVLT